MIPAVDCSSATSEHSDFRVIITQVKTQKQNFPPLFRQAEQSGCQRFVFYNRLFSLNNKCGRYLLNNKIFICTGIRVYFFEILKRYLFSFRLTNIFRNKAKKRPTKLLQQGQRMPKLCLKHSLSF